jgi:hypothetical protein
MSGTTPNNQIYLNSPLYVNQNANSYGSYLNDGSLNYDYTFLINLALMTGTGALGSPGDITCAFANASFEQSQTNADNVNINLTLFNSNLYAGWNTSFKNQNIITMSSGASTLGFSTLDPSITQTIGDRLLEIVAHKIFGNGQARAAIDNDLEFYTHDGDVWDHLSNALANQNIANDVFNQYVASGRYTSQAQTAGSTNSNSNANDVNRFVNFNFINLTFDYPLYLAGSLGLSNTITNSESAQLNNGPAVGGTQLNNGTYNIPVLIRFYA